MSMREFEAANITPPLKNTSLMKDIAALPFSPTNQVVDLRTLYGNYDNSHFYTVQADGGKVYVAFGGASGLIDVMATGVGTSVCWPIADGASINYTPIGGMDKPLGTGIATGTSYSHLHFRSPTGGATGFVRIMRSSVGMGQGSEQFKAP